MAQKGIKGITIEIGGDTKPLQKALKNVNSESISLQQELKQVDKMLKFNPGNADLVAQKQKILASQVEATTKKLDTLKEAQSQVDKQFADGKIDAEQYRAFEREVIATESSLKKLEDALSSMKDEQQKAEEESKNLAKFFKVTKSSIDDYADVLGTKLVNAINDGTANSKQLERAFEKVAKTALGTEADIDKVRTALDKVDKAKLIKIQKELENVKGESISLQKELKEVDKLLEFSPGNADLVAQKQKILASQVEATTKKLDTLKEAQSQVDKQFADGKIDAEQYRAFQREVISTETSLGKLKEAMANMDREQQNIRKSSQTLDRLFAATGKSVDDFSDALGENLVNAIKNGTASSKQLDKAIDQIGKAALGADADLDKMKQALAKMDSGGSLESVKKELKDIAKEAKDAEKNTGGLGDALGGLAGGLAAGVGISSVIEKSLETSSLNTKINITLDVPEESKESVRQAVKGVEAYGVDAESALEGVRRQWALNKGASDESNAAVIKSAGMIASAYSGIDFTELIQESNEISKTFGISNEEALGLTNALLKVGFPPEQLDIISEYGTQLINAGYTAEEIQGVFAAGIETGTWNIDNLMDKQLSL